MKTTDIKNQFEKEGFECFYHRNSKNNFNIFLTSPKGRISIGAYYGDEKKFRICNTSQLYIREINEVLMNNTELIFNVCFTNEVLFSEIEPALELAKNLALEYKRLQEKIELIKIAMDSL